MADSVAALVASEVRRRHRFAAGGIVAGEPVLWAGDPDDVFQIGSVTKVFTSLVLATYLVDGSLRLEQPLGDLMPDLTGPVALTTLGQLATHTSGLPRVPRELWTRGLRRHPDPYADVDHDMLLRFLATTRARPTGRPHYSNLGAGLLGHAMAVWAGSDYDALVAERLTNPMAMTGTGCRPPEQPAGRRRRGRPRSDVWHFDSLAGAGGLWSTVTDLQRFLVAQLHPPEGRLGEAVRLTHEVRVAGRRLDQCLGWMRLHGGGRALLWHDGGTAGYRSFVAVQPAGGLAVCVMADDDRPVAPWGFRLMRWLMGAGA